MENQLHINSKRGIFQKAEIAKARKALFDRGLRPWNHPEIQEILPFTGKKKGDGYGAAEPTRSSNGSRAWKLPFHCGNIRICKICSKSSPMQCRSFAARRAKLTRYKRGIDVPTATFDDI